MPLPLHRTPDEADRRATAPYNFVPLPESIFLPGDPPPSFATYLPERLHGWMDVSLKTLTPLYTRCAYPPELEGQAVTSSEARQQFYHHGNPEAPVIPGSSLRGAIRSLVEILSYARLTRRSESERATRILDERLIYRAVADQDTSAGSEYNQGTFLPRRAHMEFDFPAPKIQAGWLKETSSGWQIVPARTPEGTSFVRVPLTLLERSSFVLKDQSCDTQIFLTPVPVQKHSGQRRPNLFLHFAKARDVSSKPGPGFEEARLVVSGRAPMRHYHTAVYMQDNKAKPIPIPEEVWEAFHKDQGLTRGLPTRILKAGDPCFYFLDKAQQAQQAKKVAFLGPTLFFRIPYQRRVGAFVPPNTTQAGALDLAEALFGTVNPGERVKGEGTGSFRGRLRFEDLRFDRMTQGGAPFEADGSRGRRIPGILSAPKPTSFQHYLVQTGSGDKRELLSYASEPASAEARTPRASSPVTVLRGFKRYWHRGTPTRDELNPEIASLDDDKARSQRTVIRPVWEKALFKGRIHFENLTEVELGALITALKLPEGCAHQLGMGKPLGLGSVDLQPTLTFLDPSARYGSFGAPGVYSPEQTQEKAAAAMRAFAHAIHTHVGASIPEPGEGMESTLWMIPRLQTLRLMLSFDKKPARDKTAYQLLVRFKERPTLPTPHAVMGQADPRQQSERSGAPPAVPSSAASPAVPSSAASPSAASRASMVPPQVALGQIMAYFSNQVKLKLDGAKEALTVPVDARLFPTGGPGHWARLNGIELRSGRRVKVEIEQGKPSKITPL